MKKALRAAWFFLLPAAAAGLFVRFLVPTVSETRGTWAEGLARIGEEHGLPFGLMLFVAFALVVRYWSFRLPRVREVLDLHAATLSRADAIKGVAAVACAAAAVLLLRSTVMASYRVDSGSMLPTLEPGDRLIADKIAYGVRLPGFDRAFGAKAPRRGDIVIFRNPNAGEPERLIKRVIGLPGDRISMRGNEPVINGWKIPSCDAGRYLYVGNGASAHARLFVEFLEDRAYLTLYGVPRPSSVDHEVPQEEVFVLGDDRDNSSDSRAWNGGKGGGLTLSAIEGRAFRRLWHRLRNEHADLGEFLHPIGLRPHLERIDTRALEQGIDECLKRRPMETYPPPPNAASNDEQATLRGG